MFITQKALARRTFLRGIGATLALPLLDSMVPALSGAPKSTPRLGFVYVPNGIIQEQWFPAMPGPLPADLPAILKPLSAFRDQVNVMGNLAHLQANSALRTRQMNFIAAEAARHSGPLVLVGDFNTPTESTLFRRTWKAYKSAFDEVAWAWGYTFFNRWTRVRIDHILVGNDGGVLDCWVAPNVGSPHRPVFARLPP